MKKVIFFLLLVFLFFSGCAYQQADNLSEDPTVTWWCSNRYSHVGSMGDSAVYSALMDETGVHIQFIHPPEGEHRERFLLLLTERTLPDIISHDFINDYPGGAEKALNDGVIVPLNEMIDDHCPNLRAYLDANPEIEEMISTSDGRIFCFPSIQASREIRTYMGPFIRKDYLDQVKLDAPHTVEEWHTVLCAFRDELRITPLSFYGGKIMDTDFLIGSYGMSWDFYIDNGDVKLGPLEEDFAAFMQAFKGWYDEDLIASGIFTDSQETYTKKSQSGDTGVYIDYITSIEKYQASIEGAQIAPLRYPVLAEGDRAYSGHIAPVFVPFASCYITKDNQNIEATAKLLDYAYSGQGSLLFNFGIEGESYEVVDGEAKYTDALMNDPEGFSEAVKRYLASGAYIRDPAQFKQMLILDSQIEAVDLWSDTDAEQHLMPVMVLSAEQAETVAAFNEGYKDVVITWLKDYCLSGSGTTTVDELQQMLLDMGAGEVINIYQEVLDERG